jgi:transcriptional regulator with XRE-family HTH domain
MASRPEMLQDFLKEVGRNIAIYRQRKGISMTQLAEDIGAHKSAISRMERGKNLTLETLCKVAAALDVHPQTLLKGQFLVHDFEIENYIKQKRVLRRNDEH